MQEGKYTNRTGSTACDSCDDHRTTMHDGSMDCDACEPHYFMNEETCVECREGMDCDKVGNELATVTVRKGYFRAKPESKNVYRCPLKEACPGGNVTGNQLCSEGHEGVLCGRLVPLDLNRHAPCLPPGTSWVTSIRYKLISHCTTSLPVVKKITTMTRTR